jgi:hypothetical protein
MRHALLVLLLAGCTSTNAITKDPSDGGGAVLPDAAVDGAADGGMMGQLTSGSRLKAKFFTGEDGSKVYVPGTMVDTMRGEDCSIQVAADGMTRCLPAPAQTNEYFADMGCTQALALKPRGCQAPKEITASGIPTCAGAKVFSISGRFTGKVYSGSPALCGVPPDPSANWDLYSLGAEIPPSSFVAGTAGQDP